MTSAVCDVTKRTIWPCLWPSEPHRINIVHFCGKLHFHDGPLGESTPRHVRRCRRPFTFRKVVGEKTRKRLVSLAICVLQGRSVAKSTAACLVTCAEVERQRWRRPGELVALVRTELRSQAVASTFTSLLNNRTLSCASWVGWVWQGNEHRE
jgi:hypothetical protein